eukprot:gene12242-5827_t
MGYSSDLFIESPPDNLLCGICLDTFKECYVLQCGHRYCHYCLQLLLSTEEQLCAFDRKKIKSYEKDEKIDEIVLNMAVKCDQETCEWLGVLKDKKKHKCKKENQILIPPYKEQEKWYDGLILGDKEISLRVLSYLKADEVAKCQKINKNWKKLGKNDHLWKFLFKKEFDLNIKMKVTGWKQMFVDNYSYKYPNKFKYLKEKKTIQKEEKKPKIYQNEPLEEEEDSFLGDHFNEMLDSEKIVEPFYHIKIKPKQEEVSDNLTWKRELRQDKNSNVKYYVNDLIPKEKRNINVKNILNNDYKKMTQEEEDMLLFYTMELSKREAEKTQTNWVEEEEHLLDLGEEIEYEIEEEDYDYDQEDYEYDDEEDDEEEEEDIYEELEDEKKLETFEVVEFKTNTNMYVE